MNVEKNEVNEPTKHQEVLTNVIIPMLKKDDTGSVRVDKKFFARFEYGSYTGYKAFLAWAMRIGHYVQGDLAVWHWADVCRLFQSYEYNSYVVLIIQNTEYAIVGTENINDLTITFFKMRLEDLEKEIDNKSLSVSKVMGLV